MSFFKKNDLTRYQKLTDNTMLYLSFVCAVLIMSKLGFPSWLLSTTALESIIMVLFYSFGAILILKTVITFLLKNDNTKSFRFPEIALSLYFCLVITERHITAYAPQSIFQQAEWLYIGI